MAQDNSNFDKIIEHIGNTGPFQNRFAWMFNFLLVFLVAFLHMNKIISLNVPDHWCHVPGRENTNYTLEKWKNITIPKEVNAYGTSDYSKCTRYAQFADTTETMESKNEVINCDQGWEYDRTWYDMTASMQYNWVCKNKMVPTNTLALSRAGEVFGTIILGQLADNYGRLPVFFISLSTFVFGRIISVFTASWVYLFIIFSVIGSVPGATVHISPLIISMEISRADRRAFVSMLLCFGWTLGITIVPFFMWWLRDWKTFSLVTTLPCVLYFFSRPWIIESPRWLVSRGQIKKSIQVLNKVAKANKTQLPINIEDQLRTVYNEHGKSKTNTVFELFSSLRLAKNTIILVYCYSITLFIYMCFAISVPNLAGNPYLNYLYLALAEQPGNIFGKYLCGRFGRRWITTIGYIFITFGSLVAVFVIQDTSSFWLLNMICAFIKINVNMSYYTVNLQSMEIYPTCIRQSGVSLGGILGNLVTILGPYIVALGVSENASIPYCVYAVCSLGAAVSSVFLPETLGQQLPDSLKDASTFGADQDFWGQRKQGKYTHHETEIPLTS